MDMGKHILWSALMVLLLFKLAIRQTGTPILWFTDKLPSLNWFIPKRAIIFEDPPDDLKLLPSEVRVRYTAKYS